MRATLSFLAVFVFFSSYIVHAQKELSPAWTSHYIGSSIEYSEDETTFITFTEKGVTLWDAKTLTALGTFAEFGSDKEYGRKIISATLSSDGTRLVTGNSDGTVRIWSTENGNVLKTLNVYPFSHFPYESYVREVHINKQNNRIIIRTKSGLECSLWDIEAERKLNSYEYCSLLKFSKQGNLIVGLFRDTVLYVCSSNNGEYIARKTMPNHIRHIEYAEFDSTDKSIITVNRSLNSSSNSGEKNVVLWSPENLTEIQSNKVIIENPKGFTIRYSATGTKVSIITSYIYMYDIVANSWIMNKYIPKHNAHIISVNYNADKVAYMDSNSMVIYSISNDKPICSMKRNPRISYFSLNKSGDKMIGTSHFGVLHLYNSVDGESDVLMGHTDRVLYATFNEQNNLFATSGGGYSPKIWNIDGSANNYVVKDINAAQNTKYMSFNLAGNRLITINGSGKSLWDLEQSILKNRQELGIVLMGAYNRWYNKSIALVRNYDAAKTYYVNSIYLSTEQGLDIMGGDHPDKPEVPPQYNYVTLSNSTNYVAATKYNNELIIKNVWNDTESIIRTPYNNRSVVFSNDEKRILVGHTTGEITVWDVLTKKKIMEIKADPRWLQSAVFTTQDSKIMTVGHDSTAKLWNAETGVLLQTFSEQKNLISLAQIDRTGRHIVLCDNGSSTPTVWDANSGKLIAKLVGHSDTVLYATFDNSGSKVVTTSADGTVKLWDLEQATTPATTSVQDNSENNEENTVLLYPNPTDNEITITYPLLYSASQYSIANQFGENVVSGFIPKGNNTYSISLETLPAGVYFFSTEISGKKVQEKFVVVK